MNSKYFLLAFAFFSLVLLSGLGSSAECTNTIGSAGCTVSNNLTLTQGIYSFNISSSQVININGTGVTFDCNGATIFGNFTTGSFQGIYTAKGNNTIKNCIVYGYPRAFRTDVGADGLTLFNNTLGNSTSQNLLLFTNTVAYSYLNISNNVFSDSNASAGYLVGTNITHSIFINNRFTSSLAREGITLTAKNNNVSISDNIFIGNNPAIRLDSTTNSLVNNNTFYNISLNGIRSSVTSMNITLKNNSFYNVGYPFSLQNLNNSNITGNFISNGSLVTCLNNCNFLNILNNNLTFALRNEYTNQFVNNTNILFSNNYIFNQDNKGLLVQERAINLNITSNRFINASKSATDSSPFIYFLRTTSSLNNNIEYNFLNGSSNLLVLTNTSNISTKHNVLTNTRGNGDSYNNGFLVNNANNIDLINNSLSNIGCAGMLLTRVNGARLINNTIIAGGLDYNLNEGVNCAYEAIGAIFVVELWKTWLQDDFSGDDSANITLVSQYKSNNITISNNDISGFPLLFKSQGTTNLTHDITNYWFRSYQTPTYLVDRSDLYISNDWNNITTTRNDTNAQTYEVYVRNILGEGRAGSTSTIKMQFEFFREYSWFKNVNQTNNYTTALFNLTNALIYFNNGSVACTDLSTCDDNINITLTPQNYSYVLDNFNLTEGVTRQFSPLSISGSSTSKTITSSLSQAITATVVVNVGSCSFDATYEGNGVEQESCGGGITTFTLTDIPAGTSELSLVYLDIDCSSNTGASIILILIFSALAIVALTFILVMKFKEGELDVKVLIIVFIAIIVGLVLFTQIAQLTGSVCSA